MLLDLDLFESVKIVLEISFLRFVWGELFSELLAVDLFEQTKHFPDFRNGVDEWVEDELLDVVLIRFLYERFKFQILSQPVFAIFFEVSTFHSIREKRVKLSIILFQGPAVDCLEVVPKIDHALQMISVGRLDLFVHET